MSPDEERNSRKTADKFWDANLLQSPMIWLWHRQICFVYMISESCLWPWIKQSIFSHTLFFTFHQTQNVRTSPSYFVLVNNLAQKTQEGNNRKDISEMSRQCSGVMASDLKKGKMVQKTETWRTCLLLLFFFL